MVQLCNSLCYIYYTLAVSFLLKRNTIYGFTNMAIGTIYHENELVVSAIFKWLYRQLLVGAKDGLV